jgi:anti-anti-sigma factor
VTSRTRRAGQGKERRASFIDSSALSVIMRAHRAMLRDGGTLALVSPSPAVARILDLIEAAGTGLTPGSQPGA